MIIEREAENIRRVFIPCFRLTHPYKNLVFPRKGPQMLTNQSVEGASLSNDRMNV